MNAQSPESAYESLVQHSRELTWTAGLQALLEWDQEVNMPPAGAQSHSEMSGIIARIVHRKAVDERVGGWLEAAALKTDWPLVQAANIREWKRDYSKARKLPEEFVKKQAEVTARAYHVWRDARETDDFGVFAPTLAVVVDLAKQEADYYGWKDERYDALLDLFEPELTTSRCEALFADLRAELTPMVERIVAGQGPAPGPFGAAAFPIEAQADFCRRVSGALGFDFDAGRLDPTIHPFTTGIARGDARITTNYNTSDPLDSLSSTVHETGHGIYEQGVSFDGTPAGQACSTAVHESQSRLYENEVGRGRAFWRYWQPGFNAQYGTDESEDDLVRRVTWVEPGLVRTRADEVTYNLHVIVRFEIERDLFRDELEVADIPRVWRQKYKDCLGVHVPGDLDGVLQDVHWANGLFGYFPTYTLGNVYAAQLFDAARREIPGLENAIASGDFKPLRDWMAEKIYRWGRVYTPEQLIENAAGSPVSTSFFIEHLKARYLRQ